MSNAIVTNRGSLVLHLECAAMRRHLLEMEADQRGVGRILADSRDVVDIRAADAQRLIDAVVDVGLDAPDARAAQILPLLQVGRRYRDVRDRILDAIVEPGRAPGDAVAGITLIPSSPPINLSGPSSGFASVTT